MTNTRRVIISTVIISTEENSQAFHILLETATRNLFHTLLRNPSTLCLEISTARSPSSLGRFPTFHATEGKSVAKISASV